MIDLRNKIILITGATSGIGEACAYAFGKSGAKIALTGRNGDRLSALASNLNNYGTDCFFYKCDLKDYESVISLKANVESYFNDSIDILINSAGFAVLGLVENLPLSSIRENFEINFFAPISLIKLLLPGMKEKGFGQIINLSSGVGKRGLPGASSYSSSKFALNGFSESLRVELIKSNIDVINISPGLVNSNFASNIILYGKLKNTFTEGISSKPQIVAARILEASMMRKRDVTLSWKTKLGVIANFFFPKLADIILSKKL